MRAALDSRRYILGEEGSAFESEFAAYVGGKHCVGVNSGTDALTIALRAVGVRPGDEVVVPAVTFYATAEAVLHAGGRPVFADVEPATWCLSGPTVEPVITDRTTAVVPVHLFGNPAPMGDLINLARERGLWVVEDAAQAAGARLDGRRTGALADAAAFSFFPSKNLPAVGDAGALLTDDAEVAAVARRLRNHGTADRNLHTEVGYNSRLDELQAAGLRAALPHLDRLTSARREVAAAYAKSGLGEMVELPAETPGGQSSFHLYVISTPRRDGLQQALREAGIESRPYYTTPLYRQPALAGIAAADPLAAAERFAREGLAIPMGPDLTGEDVARVVDAVSEAVRDEQ